MNIDLLCGHSTMLHCGCTVCAVKELESQLTDASERIAQLNTDKVELVEENQKLRKVMEAAEKHTATCPGIEDGLHAAVDGYHAAAKLP